MRKLIPLFLILTFLTLTSESCDDTSTKNVSAKQEQARTEQNQQRLNKVQPAPQLDYSIERENLFNRLKLFNDQAVTFYMYIFNHGTSNPVMYFQVNKVSSVNSQMTNPEQIVNTYTTNRRYAHVLPSPAEDGSYGTNGDAVFGFTPSMMYIETNMQYVATSAPVAAWHKEAQTINPSPELLKQIQELLKDGQVPVN